MAKLSLVLSELNSALGNNVLDASAVSLLGWAKIIEEASV